MAKKKTSAARKIPAEPPRPQPSVINLKGSPEYRAWLAGVSMRTHIPASVIVRLALAEWAKKNGHAKPPEI